MKTPRQLDRDIRFGKRVQRLLDKWQPILGVRVIDFRIRKMRAFGSVNLPARRLWISQALVEMSPADLEYVVVHELVHLLVDDERGPGHDARFYALMDHYLPSWRQRHAKLRSGDVVASALPGMGH